MKSVFVVTNTIKRGSEDMALLVRDGYLEKVMKSFAYIESFVRMSDSINRYDVNVAIEDFFAEILNIIFGWSLINENSVIKNAPCIDLIDNANRIAVQITARNDNEKVKETIDKFIEAG